MNVRDLPDFARGVGVGAAGLLIALGAVSLFLRAGAAGPAAPKQLDKVASTPPRVVVWTESPPADYLDLCRAAGPLTPAGHELRLTGRCLAANQAED
jgi:hypothetical protein